MRPEMIEGLVEGGLPVAMGLYVTLLGFRTLGKRPGESPMYDQWYERFGSTLQVLGPLVFLFGIYQMTRILFAAR